MSRQNATAGTTAREDAHKRMTLVGEYGASQLWWAGHKSREGAVDPDNAHYFLQLVGSYAERGYAYGYLMADAIIDSAVDTFRFFEPPAE